MSFSYVGNQNNYKISNIVVYSVRRESVIK